MISNEEMLKLKANIGNRFAKPIQEILESKGQKVYSDRFISHVFNGRYENLIIERAFYELNDRMFEEKKNLQKSKKQLLKKNKPEAGTPGL